MANSLKQPTSAPGSTSPRSQSKTPTLYTITKDSSYLITLKSINENSWTAIVDDKRFPGLTRSFTTRVVIEKDFQLEDLLSKNPTWQSRHVHIIDKTPTQQPLVYIGSLGLKGGGVLNWFGMSSCTWINCYNDVWRCSCGFQCPDESCWDHCTKHYKSHVCVTCFRDRCPQYYKCQKCNSSKLCSKCCGCYERAKELERQKQKALEEQLERDRQDILRQEEFNRQREKQRQEQKDKERQEIFSQITSQIEKTQIVVEDIEEITTSVDIDFDDNEITQFDFVSSSDPFEDDLNFQRIDIDDSSNTTGCNFSSDSDSNSDSDSYYEDCVQQPITTTNLQIQNIQSNPLNDSMPSDIASFLKKFTMHLTSKEQTHFQETIGKFIEIKLPQVDTTLQKSIIDFFSKEQFLYPGIIQLYPVSEWIRQTLLTDIIDFIDEDDHSMRKLRVCWLKITQKYTETEQVSLLKTVKLAKNNLNLSLQDIADLFYLVFTTKASHWSEGNEWVSHLKLSWLLLELKEYLPSFPQKVHNQFGSQIIDLNWNVAITEHFLKFIEGEIDSGPISQFLGIVKKYQVPDAIILEITQMYNDKDNKVELWVQEIIIDSLLHKIVLSSFIIPDYKLLKKFCFADVLKSFIIKNQSLVEADPDTFGRVLDVLYDYQVSDTIYKSVFDMLPKINPTDWVNEVDTFVSEKLFKDPKVYTIDELIKLVKFDSSDISIDLKASFEMVMLSYNSPSKILSSVNSDKPIRKWKSTEISAWARDVKSSDRPKNLISELIAGVKRSVELQHGGITPRDTQILALITLLNSGEEMGRLVQINTGEGKSLIVAMLAAIHALQGKNVDIITTSTELSIPEVQRQTKFFQSLLLTVAENSIMTNKRSAYKSNVVYGVAGDFQADILRTDFMGQDIRGNRGFDVVIVDEVDSMLFDNRSHSVRLSEQTPAMVHLELILAVIWDQIQRVVSHLTTINDQLFYIIEDFKRIGNEIILYSEQDWKTCAIPVEDKRAFITDNIKKYMESVLRNLTDEEKRKYEDYNHLYSKLHALETKSSLNDSETEEKKMLINQLTVHPWLLEDQVLDVPVHLRKFAVSQIPNWIRSALTAAYGYQKGAHYTIQKGRIVPIHYNETGVLQSDMVWSDGLTQFLQLKEGLRMDPEGISTNFLSNVSFFRRYKHNIYGLTGTLGETPTKDFLYVIYNTDTVIIPPYQYREVLNNTNSKYKCKELYPIVVYDESEWFQVSINRILYHASHLRAVLVICKYLSQVKRLVDALKKEYDSNKIFSYTGEDKSFNKKYIDSGEIIVATNIAGRGTDLETTEMVEARGGMYVAVTFLPESLRVEQQNVGRTARVGKKGLAQLIIHNPFKFKIDKIKKNRDDHEKVATEKATQDAHKIQIQDWLFATFCHLENGLLPSVGQCEQLGLLDILETMHHSMQTNPIFLSKMSKAVDEKIEKVRKELVEHSFNSLTGDQKSKLTENDKISILEQIKEKVEALRSDFTKQHQKQTLNQFLHKKYPSSKTNDLITLTIDQKKYTTNLTELAKKHDWGLYERKGLEELWGFWLKNEHLDVMDLTLIEATDWFNSTFASDILHFAQEDKLIQNPYYYVLKGNDYLTRDKLDKAISCYDKAIAMDPDFSVNARYNKARALLSYGENKGQRQEDAKNELEKAKTTIDIVLRQNLMTLSILVGQYNKMQTSEHVQHQLNILGQQEIYIDNACRVIKEAQSEGNNVSVSIQHLPETFSSNGNSEVIQEAAVNGLTHFFTANVVRPALWESSLYLAVTSITLIVQGVVFSLISGVFESIYFISNILSNLIYDDPINEFEFAPSSIVHHAVSLAVSLMNSGIESIKRRYLELSHNMKESMGRSSLTEISQKIKLAKKEIKKSLRDPEIKKFFKNAYNWKNRNKVINDVEQLILKTIEDSIKEAFSNNPTLVEGLKLDNKKGNNNWQNHFIQLGLSVMNKQNKHSCFKKLQKISLEIAEKSLSSKENCSEINELQQELNKYIDDFFKKFDSKIKKSQSEIISGDQGAPTYATENLHGPPPLTDLKDSDISLASDNGTTMYSTDPQEPITSSGQHFLDLPSNMKYIIETLSNQITRKMGNVLFENSNANDVSANSSLKPKLHVINKRNEKFRTKIKTINEKCNLTEQVPLECEKKEYQIEEGKKSFKEETTSHDDIIRTEIERLEMGEPLNNNDYEILAAITNASIYIINKKNKRLVDVTGVNLHDKTIVLLYTPSNGTISGYWEPYDKTITVESSGTNNCLIDNIYAHLDLPMQCKLMNSSGLKTKIIEAIKKNPRKAIQTYEMRDRVAQIAPFEIRLGGRQPCNDEWNIIKNFKDLLANRLISIRFDTILKVGGERFQYFGEGSGQAEFEKLKKAYELKDDDVRVCANGIQEFKHENLTITFCVENQSGNGKYGRSIRFKDEINSQEFVVKYEY